MDFYKIKERSAKNGVTEIYPDFVVTRSKDLMVQGKSFYAIWDEEAGLWSTDEYDVQRLVDEDLMNVREEVDKKNEGVVQAKLLSEFSSRSWVQFKNYISNLSDSSHPLDDELTFQNTKVNKSDYVSKRLPYALEHGDISAYDELMSTLYSEEERAKIEWAIGAVISGDAKYIQKFLVLYGSAGTGKSTVLNIIQKIFDGYYTTFEAKALTSNSNAFSTEVFRNNPLVAIQHDGDLSKIEDNTKLNSIVSHEEMTMNEKYKPSYMARVNCFLFMGTNKPVKITDSKSGVIRRLIDVKPTGNKLPGRKYSALYSQIDFELGHIAHYCLEVYRKMGRDYYNGYRPIEMMLQTDIFFNFIEHYFDVFKEQDGVTLNQAYEMYKTYCDESLVEYRLAKHKFREELKNYFRDFEERATVGDVRVRSWYGGFDTSHFTVQKREEDPLPLTLGYTESIFDEVMSGQPAQYATENGTPESKWDNVTTTLGELDTTRLHFVKVPRNHIVIDFDLKNDEGTKSLEKNLEEASKWPATYSEYSKSGAGLHLHYLYDGDVDQLANLYSDGIEIKVYRGNSSLRRKLTRCNNIPVAHISSGLPIKEKSVTSHETIKSEKALRDLITRNLKKEIHPGTKPSIDFIHKILEDAYSGDVPYDVSDMKPKIMAFANNSSNNAMYCLKRVMDMKFESENQDEGEKTDISEDRLAFYDVEVFPNLLIVCWKFEGDAQVVRMINPSPQEVENLFELKLVGFNNRKYDNHILYARYMGYSNEQLYELSQKIVNNTPGATFGEAYNISYADIYDFSSKKQSLKRFQIELGLKHKELGIPWDEQITTDRWEEVADYCENDVKTTEQVFDARRDDFVARKILADLSGLSVNSTTQRHTARIIFGTDKNPKRDFVYTDLSEMFPGYEFEGGKSTYKGIEVGEGGYVYAEPGMYENVAVLDVASMHPTSIEQLNLFGPYTKNFSDLKDARVAIKRGDYESARKMLGGILKPYLEDEGSGKELAFALKIVINIVYGLTSAKFDNPFRDNRNVDNIVAKRGALFMVDLQKAVQEKGYQVVHIKTDSIKIVSPDKDIIDFVTEFGNDYGYEFEHEGTYSKFCLVNDAVYIAKEEDGDWTATGAQFAHPYVFKKLFSGDPIEFRDMCETRTVTTALYLDMNSEDTPMAVADPPVFIGRAGSFCPMTNGQGGLLYREKDGSYHSVSGTKNHRWLESEVVEQLGLQDDIDKSYFEDLCDSAITKINQFGDFEEFVSS